MKIYVRVLIKSNFARSQETITYKYKSIRVIWKQLATPFVLIYKGIITIFW